METINKAILVVAVCAFIVLVGASAALAVHMPSNTPESLVYIGELPIVDVFVCTKSEVSGICFVHQGEKVQYLIVIVDELLYEVYSKDAAGLQKLFPTEAPPLQSQLPRVSL